MQRKGSQITWFVLILFLALCPIFTVDKASAERSWYDAAQLIKVSAENNQTRIYFNLPHWVDLYDIWDLKDECGEAMDFRSGPFPVVGLEGEIKDVLILSREEFNWFDYSSLPTPAVFFLMKDGTVDFLLADLYDTINYGFTWEPEFYTLGRLPFLKDVQSIKLDGMPLAIDSQGLRYDLNHAVSLKYLTDGYWTTQLVSGEGDLVGINGYLKFKPNGEVRFEAIAVNQHQIRQQRYEIWTGTYSVILAEGDHYEPGTLLVDLSLNWWIWEGVDGDLGPTEYRGVYSLTSGPPWYLKLDLLEGRTFYPYPEASDSYLFWVDFPSEYDQGFPWKDEQYALNYVDYTNLAEVSAFLAAGNLVNGQNTLGQTPLMLALNNGTTVEVVKLLLAAGAKHDVFDYDGNSVMFTALWNEVDPEIILALLHAQIDVKQATYGSSPFVYAILYDYSSTVIQAFIEAGADPNDIDYGGLTALMSASLSSHETAPEITKLLLDLGIDVNQRDFAGYTALHYAAVSHGNTEVVKALLTRGASVNLREINGYTPLMLMGMVGSNPELIKILLDAGADGKLKSVEGKTAFEYALENENLNTTAELWLLNEARF